MMRELPAGWSFARLGQLMHSIEAGLNVKCEERVPEENEAGLVKISAVTWGRFDEQQSKTLPLTIQPDERNRIHKGDLLISRANTIELVGACVIVGEVQRRLYLSDKVLRLLVHEPSKRWINYALKTPQLRKAIQSSSTGNQLSMRNIPQDKLRALEIPLAPEPEQQRITDQLDTLLARVQACNDRFDAIPALLKRFRQTVLDAALNGGFSTEMASLSSRNSYPKVRLSEVAESRLGKMLDKQKNSGTPTPYIGNINVRWFSFDLENLKFISIEGREKAGLEIRDGDVFICEGGEPGRCAIWNMGPTNVVFQKALHRVRPVKERLLSQWLAYCIRNMTDTEQLKPLYTGTTIRHLTGASLSQVLLPLPSVEEQAEIVRRVEALFALADRIEARCTAARAQAQRLTPLVLAKAFRGELVPQDSTDEPASALLARIASSDTAVAGKNKQKIPAALKEHA